MKREALRTESDTSQSVTSLRLLAMAPAPAEISIGTPPYGRLLRIVSLRVELALLLLPLPQRERVLDPAREPGHDRLHLRDLVGRQREERLVGQDLAA